MSIESLDCMALVVRPRQAYIDWADSFDDDGPKYRSADHHARAYLINEVVDPGDIKKVVRRYWREIFEEEFSGWMLDPEVWPRRRTLGMFLNWFDVTVCDMVADLGRRPIHYD